jgi:Putative cyclase
MQVSKYVAAVTSVLSLVTIIPVAGAREEPSLWKIQKTLAAKKYVDLTHAFEPGIPRWPGFPDETRKTIYWYDKRPDTMGSGFFSEVFSHVGQWGTHVDPPAHFVKELRTLDQIDPKEMFLPLVVIDVHEEAAKNPDYTLSIERLKKWEKGSWQNSHGRIRCDADRLVKALARRGENGKQRRKWRRSLPGLEFAGAKISLRRTQNHRVRARNDGYRSGNRRLKGRLLAGNLYLEHEPLSDRVAHQSRSSSRIRRNRCGHFSKT